MADEDTSPIQSATEGMPDASSAATILAGMNPPPTGPQPMEVTPSGPSQSAVAGVPQPPNPEVEREYHMGWLHSVLDKVGTALGGGETVHVTKDADGNVTMTRDPATTGEKWGRIAQAALSGAGAGFANSTGPNAPAAAAAAGIQAGAQQGQQERQQAQQEATAEQQLQLRNAQKALVQQQVAANAFKMHEQGIALTDAQSDRANQVQGWILSNPSNKKVGDFSSMQDVMDYENTHGGLIQGHTNGSFHTEVMGDGKVRLFTVDQGWLDQKNDKDVTVKRLEPGDTADAPMQLKDYTIPAGTMTNREIAQFQEAQTARISKYQLDISGQEEKATAAKEATAQRAEAARDRAMYQGTMTQIAQENAETRRLMANNAGGAGAPGGALHGDAYLATIPENQRAQVKSIANGDAKMPSGARSGSVQALRNMVFNYDPTYSDARYDTKMNFKTKGDAQNLQSLSTGLEHLERATTNSTALGISPSELTGRNLSGTAAAYNDDIKLFSQEAGKLIKNGVLGEKEYNDLKSSFTSPIPSIRAASLKEMTNLLAGRVAAGFQKYKTGAKQDLPVNEFFDQPTQQRLQRYGMTQQAPDTHTFNAGAWKQAHPNEDVKAAIAQAQQQGYTVTNAPQ